MGSSSTFYYLAAQHWQMLCHHDYFDSLVNPDEDTTAEEERSKHFTRHDESWSETIADRIKRTPLGRPFVL